MVAHSFGWGSILALNIFLPMYLQSVLGWSATDSGLSLIVLMVTLNASAGISSQLIGRVVHYKLLPQICLCVGIGAMLTLALSAAHMSSLQFEIILFLIGIGFGPTAPLTQVALQNTVPIRHLGSAIGTMNFVRTLMGTILVAVFGAIVLGGLPVGAAADPSNRHIMTGISAGTFATVFFTAAAALTIAFVAMFRLEEKPLETTMPPPSP
jgi:MFS family permease